VRLAFLGTTAFAVEVLRDLAAATDHPVALVVTPPDRPRGRGRRLAKPPVAEVAEELGIDLHQTESVNLEGSRAAIAAAGAELGVVCAFGQLIREPLLSDLEMLNIHPSLLPRWRGAAPIERAIMAGDSRTGVSIARVTAGLDSGPVALSRPVAIEPDDDYGSLAPRLASVAGPLARRALGLRAEGTLEVVEQDDAAASYAEKIDSAERRLDPSRPAAELERIVRALTPHIGAHVELDGGERLRVTRARAEQGKVAAGETASIEGRLLLGCGDGVLDLLEVQPAGGRAMGSAEYLRGHPAPRLRSPAVGAPFKDG
jgi:methionyl-tRNA formyltransferase